MLWHFTMAVKNFGAVEVMVCGCEVKGYAMQSLHETVHSCSFKFLSH